MFVKVFDLYDAIFIIMPLGAVIGLLAFSFTYNPNRRCK